MKRGRENQRLVTCLRAHFDDFGLDPRISIRARGGSCAATNEAGHTTAPDRVHRTTEDPRSERVYLAHGQPRLSTRSAGPALRSGPLGDSRGRPCGKRLRASREAGPRSTGTIAATGSRSAVAKNHRSRLSAEGETQKRLAFSEASTHDRRLRESATRHAIPRSEDSPSK